mmetsp:Transcript_27311/g.78643  ORF Transcript_27311/g.78643 Transcript_27311/m.78643 type:complete len:117 (+) Transcript_27311:78-428(+)
MATAAISNYVVPDPPPKPLLLFITNVKTARTVWIEISINDPVGTLKRYVSRKMDIPVEDMVLIYMGEELKNDFKIKECKLDRVIQKVANREEPHSDECTIHMIDLKDTPTDLKGPS